MWLKKQILESPIKYTRLLLIIVLLILLGVVVYRQRAALQEIQRTYPPAADDFLLIETDWVSDRTPEPTRVISKIVDLAQGLPDEEKIVFIVQRAHGSFEKYIVPGGEDKLELLNLGPNDKIIEAFPLVRRQEVVIETLELTSEATTPPAYPPPLIIYEGPPLDPTQLPYPEPRSKPEPTRTPVPLEPPADSPAGSLAFIARRDDGSVSLNSLAIDTTGMLSGTLSLALSDETRRLEGHIYPSPDGSRLTWVDSVENGSVGYFIDTQTGQIDPFITMISTFFGWHPDNNHFLAENGADFGLWLFDIFGNRYIPLDVRGWGLVRSATISPDGQKIIFTYRLGINSSREVWMIDSDGHNAFQLYDLEIGGVYSWSPDGEKILVHYGGLGLVDANGNNPRLLNSQIPMFVQCYLILPQWSPDSRTLAVVTDGGNQSFCQGWSENIFQGTDIYLIDAESGVAHTLLDDGITGNIDPAWSPDGSMLAFVSNRSGTPEIWVVNADGSNLRQMTNAGEFVRFPYWRRP